MRYSGIECVSCKKLFEEHDDIVVCPICGTPHHRECWMQNNECVNKDKHSDSFAWQAPEIETPKENFDVKNELGAICPRCGTNNPIGTSVCPVCGLSAFHPTQQPDINTAPNVDQGGIPIPPNETVDSIPVSELAQFIRVRTHFYIPRFVRMEKQKKKAGWNWAAFLLGPFWFLFRKMYALGTALLVIDFSISLVLQSVSATFINELQAYNEAVASGAIPYEEMMYNMPVPSIPTLVLIAVFFIFSILMGIYGNYLYKKNVVDSINKIRTLATDMPSYTYLLIMKGGVNFPVACLFYLAFTIITDYIIQLFS